MPLVVVGVISPTRWHIAPLNGYKVLDFECRVPPTARLEPYILPVDRLKDPAIVVVERAAQRIV